jgi:hypothetical protein
MHLILDAPTELSISPSPIEDQKEDPAALAA